MSAYLDNQQQKVSDIKFGNITFGYFISKLDIDFNHVKGFEFIDLNISDQTEKRANFELKIDLTEGFFLNDDDSIKNALKKLSKHSRKFDFFLNEIVDNHVGSRSISVYFKTPTRQIFPIKAFPQASVSIETIRDIVGLKKNIDYYSISDKPCNNGWQYTFHTADVECLNIPYFAELIQNSKLSNDFYIKVFADKFKQLRIIIQRKNSKVFFRNGIPQVNILHIASILRVNDALIFNNYVCVTHKNCVDFILLNMEEVKINPRFVIDEMISNFKEFYDVFDIGNGEQFAFRFIPKSKNKNIEEAVEINDNSPDSKEFVISTILKNVKHGLLSVEDATDILKAL